MKIYNKKDFFFGLFWVLIGVSWLILCAVTPKDFLLLQAKHVVLVVLCLAGSVVGVCRSLSRTATREDKDESNALVKPSTSHVTIWLHFIGFLLCLATYLVTKNFFFGVFFVVLGVLSGLDTIFIIAFTLYHVQKV